MLITFNNSENILDSTFIHLTEPFNDSELFIVGTTNQSNVLANRTKRLIQELKPDVVFVQTNEEWWRGAQLLGHVKSQEEMDIASKDLNETLKVKHPKMAKKFAFDLRWNLFKACAGMVYKLPYDFNPFAPGLEVKYALEEANKINSKVVFLGSEIDVKTSTRFYHETRYTLLKFLKNYYQIFNNRLYGVEFTEWQRQINTYGIRKFLESSFDQYSVNWYILI